MKNFLLGCAVVLSIVLFIWCLSVEERMNKIIIGVNTHIEQFQKHNHE